MKPALNTRPKLLRASIARGLSAGEKPVDEKGGDFGAGIIRGMAILTRGEALGHRLWCDRVMLQQVCDAINASERGIKARFTHPDLSGDGLGKSTGRVKNASVDGDVVRGDLHFSQAAHQTPDGDLAGYVMLLAMEDPEAFGNSIAFDEDFVEEDKFRAQHSEADGEGYPEFKSPDPQNIHNYLHARVAALRAVDAVDDPAANPNGLFHRGDEIARDAERLLAWTLGLSSQKPQLVSLDLDPDRAAGFIQRFLARHQLTLSREGKPMTTAELDASLAKQFASQISPTTAKKLAASKEDRDEDREAAGEEEGDADKDEGQDKDEKEAGGDFDSKEEDEKLDDDEDEDTTGLSKKKLAKGGEAPGGSAAGDVGAVEEEKQKTQKGVTEGAEADAKEGTTVESPSKDKKKGIGPMGDASTNVGYSTAVAECAKFTKAFGAQGAVWFGEGKSFAEAQQLHAAALQKENSELKKQNADLAAKAAKNRGLSKPLNAGGESSSITPEQQKLGNAVGGGGMARFALGVAAQMASLTNRKN
jgi:hypothetical protein